MALAVTGSCSRSRAPICNAVRNLVRAARRFGGANAVVNFLDVLVVAKVALGVAPFDPPLSPEDERAFNPVHDARVDFLDVLLAANGAVAATGCRHP